MPKPGVVSLLVVTLVTSSTGLRADPPQELAPGARIRVLGTGGTSEGTLAVQDAASLTLRGKSLSDPPLVVPRASVTKLYVSGGHARGKAAIIGAAIGLAVAGGLVVAASACDSSGECGCSGSGCPELLAILGIPAAAMGAGVGALVAPERWHEIPVANAGPAAALSFPGGASSSRVHLALLPLRGGAAASVTCSF